MDVLWGENRHWMVQILPERRGGARAGPSALRSKRSTLTLHSNQGHYHTFQMKAWKLTLSGTGPGRAQVSSRRGQAKPKGNTTPGQTSCRQVCLRFAHLSSFGANSVFIFWSGLSIGFLSSPIPGILSRIRVLRGCWGPAVNTRPVLHSPTLQGLVTWPAGKG